MDMIPVRCILFYLVERSKAHRESRCNVYTKLDDFFICSERNANPVRLNHRTNYTSQYGWALNRDEGYEYDEQKDSGGDFRLAADSARRTADLVVELGGSE